MGFTSLPLVAAVCTSQAGRADTRRHGELFELVLSDKNRFRHSFDHMINRVAVIRSRCNIEKGNLISSFVVIALGYFDRITCISNIQEFNAFNDSPVINIETGNNTLR